MEPLTSRARTVDQSRRARADMRLLVVVNKALPDNDYRRAFPALSRAAAEVVFGLPERPPTLEPDRFVCLGFGEGVSRADILDFLDLYRLLRRERGNLDVVHFYSTKLVLLGPLIRRPRGQTGGCPVNSTTAAESRYASGSAASANANPGPGIADTAASWPLARR